MKIFRNLITKTSWISYSSSRTSASLNPISYQKIHHNTTQTQFKHHSRQNKKHIEQHYSKSLF